MSHPSSYQVGQAYLRLHKRLHRMVDDAMNATGVSLARAKVLAELDHPGPMNQATLAANLGIAPRSITDTVDSLQRDGLAERTPDPADRRAWIVGITPAGSAALERATTAKHEVFDQIFGALDAASRTRFIDLLQTIERSLSTPSGEPSCRTALPTSR